MYDLFLTNVYVIIFYIFKREAQTVKHSIKFTDGKLKVMQVSDLQDTKRTCVDTLRFIDAALEKEKPDIIVLTGDQLDVVGIWGEGEVNRQNVRRAIKGLFSVFEKHGIPYALTFGNHDGETGVSVEEQAKIYAELKHCIGFEDLNDGRPCAGTFNIPVLSSDRERTVLNFYMMDTHNTKEDRAYKGLYDDQLEWYEKKSDELGRVPSMVFQHIAPDQVYELLTEVKKGTKGALPAYGKRGGEYFVLNGEKIKSMHSYGETPSVTHENNREFSLMKERGDVIGIFFGHDHYNGFIGNTQGMDLGYCPGAGYNTYGLKNRAVRIFEFDENDVRNYNSYIVEYKDCCKKSETAPIRNFLYCHAPSCRGMAKSFAAKCVAILLGIALLFVLLGFIISGRFVLGLLTGLAVGGAIYGVISLIYNSVLRKKLLGKGE